MLNNMNILFVDSRQHFRTIMFEFINKYCQLLNHILSSHLKIDAWASCPIWKFVRVFPEYSNWAIFLTNQRTVKLVCPNFLANHMKEKLVYSETIFNFPGSCATQNRDPPKMNWVAYERQPFWGPSFMSSCTSTWIHS